MSVVQRMKDMTRATFNEMLEKAEDPIQCIDVYLAEQKKRLNQLNQLYKDHLQHLLAMKKKFEQSDVMVNKREEQATIALKAEELEIARLALHEKVIYEVRRNQYKALYMQGKESFGELEEQLQTVQQDIQEIVEKRQYYAARMESLKLQKKWNEQTSTFGSRNPNGWFNRVEDTLSELEYEASAFRKLRSDLKQQVSSYSDHVETEIMKLKQKLVNEGRKDS